MLVIVLCPKGRLGRVIGKEWETTRSLQQVSGTSISVDQGCDPARIFVHGAEANVVTAVGIVLDIVQGCFQGFAIMRQMAYGKEIVDDHIHGNHHGQPRPSRASDVVYVPCFGLAARAQVDRAISRANKQVLEVAQALASQVNHGGLEVLRGTSRVVHGSQIHATEHLAVSLFADDAIELPARNPSAMPHYDAAPDPSPGPTPFAASAVVAGPGTQSVPTLLDRLRAAALLLRANSAPQLALLPTTIDARRPLDAPTTHTQTPDQRFGDQRPQSSFPQQPLSLPLLRHRAASASTHMLGSDGVMNALHETTDSQACGLGLACFSRPELYSFSSLGSSGFAPLHPSEAVASPPWTPADRPGMSSENVLNTSSVPSPLVEMHGSQALGLSLDGPSLVHANSVPMAYLTGHSSVLPLDAPPVEQLEHSIAYLQLQEREKVLQLLARMYGDGSQAEHAIMLNGAC